MYRQYVLDSSLYYPGMLLMDSAWLVRFVRFPVRDLLQIPAPPVFFAHG